MIRFITNSAAFEPLLREVLDFEIDYLSPNDGILYIEEDKKSVLQLFMNQLSNENSIHLTCLDCYGQDELTYQALLLAQRIGQGSLHRLSKILLIGLLSNETNLIDLMSDFIQRIDVNHLEFAKAYINQEGHGINTANELFIHRNTVNNRLVQFEELYQIDLRNPSQRICLDILLTNYQFKQ